MYTIVLEKAHDHREICTEYVRNHKLALSEFGVNQVGTLNNSWFHLPKVYMVNAYDSVGDLIGGIRLEGDIYRSSSSHFMKSLKVEAGNVSTIIEPYSLADAAEICGLWIHKNHRGSELTNMLLYYAVAVCPKIGINSLVSISSAHALKLSKHLGFRRIESLVNKGKIEYPKKGEFSYFVQPKNTLTIEYASPKAQKKISAIRTMNSKSLKAFQFHI